ncbi:Hypothetical protein H16_B1791 [Cupriavidus necator H16]|uniref:Hydroxyquinol 1,2-dioxygenase n=1 Tax=Cupriavidus necator (strain ATCC 17699 / DSM 428 / KCTC 22496 / NCIMB 10442 / H16 / Stanier 337) TaxID=381666 RepID=Q0K0A1_CUPNH|nr:Hypothetical protein H16_B1791 [Cupriavidus necator H16]
MYQAQGTIRALTETGSPRYSADTPVSFNASRGPTACVDKTIPRPRSSTQTSRKPTKITDLTKRIVLALALAAAAAGAQAAGPGARDPFSEGARSVQDARNAFTDGARAVQDARDPYTEGARNVDPYDKGARILAGWDRTGPSADPARSFDPYQDGAHA